ncbi:MAG: hypothetical protein H0W25_02335 [Acidimicrobiia bacterium]|nr:hypothetical protein [Acidimicrobiia bacterium]
MAHLPTPDQRALATAGRQHAALAHHQAVAAGLSHDQIEWRAEIGRWRRPVRGVYTIAGSPDSALQRLWVAYLACERAGGVVSHVSAAALEDLTPFSTLPHISVPAAASARSRAARVHRSTVPAQDWRWRDGMRVTTVSRTLVDVAGLLDRPSLEEVVDAAFCRQLASSASVEAAAERSGARIRGSQLRRSVTAVWSSRIEPGSVAEVRLLRQLQAEGASGVVTQHEVRNERGLFVARLDVAVPDLHVGLEYDGTLAHSPRSWDRDESRYAELRRVGWQVAPVSKLDLVPGEPRLRDLVRSWQLRRAA